MANSIPVSQRVTDPELLKDVIALEEEVSRLLHRSFELMDYFEDSVNETVRLEKLLKGEMARDSIYAEMQARIDVLENELATIKGSKIMKISSPLRELYIKLSSKIK